MSLCRVMQVVGIAVARFKIYQKYKPNSYTQWHVLTETQP